LRLGLLSAWVAALLFAVLAATLLLALPVQVGPFASLGAVAAAAFWATLRSCSVAAGGGYSVRPRLSVAVAGVALLLTLLSLWAMPACYVRD